MAEVKGPGRKTLWRWGITRGRLPGGGGGARARGEESGGGGAGGKPPIDPNKMKKLYMWDVGMACVGKWPGGRGIPEREMPRGGGGAALGEMLHLLPDACRARA